MDVDTKIIQDVLDKKPIIEFSTYSQEQHTIQNKRFSLGSAWIIAKPVLSEEEQSRLRKEINKNPEQNTHPVHFATTPEDQGLIYHLDLLSPDDFESLHEDPRYRKFALDHLINKLFDTAMFENQGINIDVLINCFDSAAKQLNGYGKPYNMLPRATAEELKLSLKIHLSKLKNSQRSLLFSKLTSLKLLSEEDTGLIFIN